jgi:titin
VPTGDLIVKPDPPTGVTATRVSDTQFTITWARHPSGAGPYDSQHVDRWDNVTNAWTRIANLSGTSTSLTNTGTVAGRRYRWRVLAQNSAGNSAWAYSNFPQTTPLAPSEPAATRSTTSSYTLSWKNNQTGNNYDYTTLIEESVNGGAFSQIDSVGEGVTSYTRSDLVVGNTYQWRFRTKNTPENLTSAYSASTSSILVIGAPAAPSGLSVVHNSDASFEISWTNNATASQPYSNVIVSRKVGDNGIWTFLARLSGSATSYVDSHTTENIRVQWRVAAENDAGSSDYATSAAWQTKPAAPSDLVQKAVPGGLSFTWTNHVGYSDYTTQLRYWKNGVLQTDTISLAGGVSSYALTGVDFTATYQFGVRAVSTVGYASQSSWVDSTPALASAPPNAPVGLKPTGVTIDPSTANTFSWTHSPSSDGSTQSGFDIRYSTNGGSTWTTPAKVTSTTSSWTMPANTVSAGSEITWQVRTYGVSPDPGAWSSVATVDTSLAPVVTLVRPDDTTLESSALIVEWTYSDPEAMLQARWEIELYDGENNLFETKSASNNATQTTLSTIAVDGGVYKLRLRVQDGDGLWSDWIERDLTCSFIPPAEPTYSIDYVADAGVNVITLTPTEVIPGTNVAPTGVDIQRRVFDKSIGGYGPWETIAAGVSPDATLIDTTATIANDGEYRIVTHSAIPSSRMSLPVVPNGYEPDWLYVSGGPMFGTVCRMVGNISISRSASRERTYYNFAGRKKAVGYGSETTNRTMTISGLLDASSSSPEEWEQMVATCDVLLLRSPLGDRLYGSVDQVDTEFIGNDLYSISFTIQEVDL